jgi:hypothetical protein
VRARRAIGYFRLDAVPQHPIQDRSRAKVRVVRAPADDHDD